MISVRRASILIPLVASIFAGSTCGVFSDARKADSIRGQMQSAFDFTDSTLTSVEEFNTSFLANAPTFELMKSDLDILVPLDAQLVQAQVAVTDAKDLQQDMTYLNMPDWYTGPYSAAVNDQITKRQQAVTEYQTILIKEENFALAVTSFYNGLYKFYSATDAVNSLPPLDPTNPTSLADEVERIKGDISQATSDFNSAAAYVNVELFTRMRDSAVDFQQALNTLEQMVRLLEDMQQETDPDELQLQSDQMDQLSFTLDNLLSQFSAGIPTEYLDEQDHFTTLALKDFIAWRATNLDPTVKTARALLLEIEQVDAAANTIYTLER